MGNPLPTDQLMPCSSCRGAGYFCSGHGNWAGERFGTHGWRPIVRLCPHCSGCGASILRARPKSPLASLPPPALSSRAIPKSAAPRFSVPTTSTFRDVFGPDFLYFGQDYFPPAPHQPESQHASPSPAIPPHETRHSIRTAIQQFRAGTNLNAIISPSVCEQILAEMEREIYDL